MTSVTLGVTSGNILSKWESQSFAQVIIHQDKIYLSHGAERARLIPTYHALIQRVRLRVKLPDMVIPLNPGQSLGLRCTMRITSSGRQEV